MAVNETMFFTLTDSRKVESETYEIGSFGISPDHVVFRGKFVRMGHQLLHVQNIIDGKDTPYYIACAWHNDSVVAHASFRYDHMHDDSHVFLNIYCCPYVRRLQDSKSGHITETYFTNKTDPFSYPSSGPKQKSLIYIHLIEWICNQVKNKLSSPLELFSVNFVAYHEVLNENGDIVRPGQFFPFPLSNSYSINITIPIVFGQVGRGIWEHAKQRPIGLNPETALQLRDRFVDYVTESYKFQANIILLLLNHHKHNESTPSTGLGHISTLDEDTLRMSIRAARPEWDDVIKKQEIPGLGYTESDGKPF